MKAMTHPSEEDLIAYQLHEGADEAAVRAHLEGCASCAELSESIAQTLRVFSADPVPEPNLDHQWQRLRGNLSELSAAPRRRFRLPGWPALGLAMAAVALLLMVASPVSRMKRPVLPAGDQVAVKAHGPLTMTPTDPQSATQIANHLDRAERLLTEVNHASGALDETTRSQAHELLLSNAVYMQTARERGDLGEASVLENLGRVLTNIDHERAATHRGWHLRFEMNTDGLLLEIRILRQNDSATQ